MVAIYEFFEDNFCEKYGGSKHLHNSIDLYAKINNMVEKELLKWYEDKNDHYKVFLRINYDKSLVDEILKQFPQIQIHEFLETL